jgi:hypothetical protein
MIMGNHLLTHLSDMARDSSEFRLRECFLMFVALLAVGVLAYSFLFERWTIIDSLYFTVIMLTTTGYGDIAPSTAGVRIPIRPCGNRSAGYDNGCGGLLSCRSGDRVYPNDAVEILERTGKSVRQAVQPQAE